MTPIIFGAKTIVLPTNMCDRNCAIKPYEYSIGSTIKVTSSFLIPSAVIFDCMFAIVPFLPSRIFFAMLEVVFELVTINKLSPFPVKKEPSFFI